MKPVIICCIFFAFSWAVNQEDRDKIEKIANDIIEESEKLREQSKSELEEKVASIIEGKEPSCYANDLKPIQEDAIKFIDSTLNGLTQRMKDAIELARTENDEYDFQVMVEEIESGKLENDRADAVDDIDNIVNNGYLGKLKQIINKC